MWRCWDPPRGYSEIAMTSIYSRRNDATVRLRHAFFFSDFPEADSPATPLCFVLHTKLRVDAPSRGVVIVATLQCIPPSQMWRSRTTSVTLCSCPRRRCVSMLRDTMRFGAAILQPFVTCARRVDGNVLRNNVCSEMSCIASQVAGIIPRI